jgi:colanic acid biosynthesis glycosyl transferase WcaI
MPEALASADVLVATLDTRASDFAVPSKILSYLCAGRALLLAAPAGNLAARVIQRSVAGIAVDPEQTDGWIAAAKRLAADPALRGSLGANARQYAKATFRIPQVAAAFEEVLQRSCGRRQPESLPAVDQGSFGYEELG